MKHQLALAAILLSCATSAFAQQRGFGNNNNNNNNRGNQQQGRNGQNRGATLPLPDGVKSLVSIDAYNVLLAASEGDNQGDTVYTPIVVRHVYSGGLAALFGGTSVPTAQFVSPGTQNGGFGQFGGGQFGGQGGQGGFGGQQGFGGGIGGNQFGGGGFGGGGFGGGNQFGGGGFGGGNQFGGGGFNTIR